MHTIIAVKKTGIQQRYNKEKHMVWTTWKL